MKSAVVLLLAVVAAQAPGPNEVPVAQEPLHHLVLENQYTRVYQVEVPPGKATLLHRHDNDYVFVVLGDAHISNEVAGQPARDMQVKDGDVNFAKGGFAHIARNVGETPFRNVTIEVLRKSTKFPQGGSVGSGSDGLVTDMMIDTDAVKAVRHRIDPGHSIGRHRHIADHLLVAISDLNMRSDIVGKGAVEVRQKAGDAVWVPGGYEHTLTNVGKQPARFVTLEFR